MTPRTGSTRSLMTTSPPIKLLNTPNRRLSALIVSTKLLQILLAGLCPDECHTFIFHKCRAQSSCLIVFASDTLLKFIDSLIYEVTQFLILLVILKCKVASLALVYCDALGLVVLSGVRWAKRYLETF